MVGAGTSLERFRYWQGQKLRSRDFRDQLARETLLRGLHNRALHSAPGISSGFAVTEGVGFVSVSCGVGYDCAARELILARPVERLPIPPAGDGRPLLLVLLPAVKAAAVPTCCEPPASTCASASRSRLVWAAESDWDGQGLPLARLRLESGAYKNDLQYQPLYTRPLARPRLAAGETVRGNTPWEIWTELLPNEAGLLVEQAVGVQTVIDTSAAGFTATPHYFATLQAPKWTVPPAASGQPNPEFAPAYFAHIAGPAAGKFTFRLLLQVALRSYAAAQAIARARDVQLRQGLLIVELDDASGFRTGDAVALVRPRGEEASMIEPTEEAELTLRSTSGLGEDDRVVIGNLPRRSRVTDVQSASVTTVPVAASLNIRAGDVLAFIGMNPRAVAVGSVENNIAVLEESWDDIKGKPVVLFDHTAAVKIAEFAPDETGGTMTVKFDDPVPFAAGDQVLRLGTKKKPPSLPSEVVAVAANRKSIQVKPALSGLAKNLRLAGSRAEVSFAETATQTGPLRVLVEDMRLFRPGDFVMSTGAAASPGVIDSITNEALIIKPANFPVAKGEELVAANLTGAAFVEFASDASSPNVSRPEAFRTGNVVSRVESSGLGPPVSINQVQGGTLRLNQSIPQLAREQILIAGEFPPVAMVVGVPAADSISVTPAGAIAAGQWIARLNDPSPSFVMAQVTAVEAGGVLRLHRSLSLQPGDTIGVVHFRDAGVIQSPPEDNRIEVAPAFDARTGDFIARLEYFADNSVPVVVESIAGQTLRLQPLTAGTELPGSGIVKQGLIDGGLIALASLSPSQKRVRLEDSSGLVFDMLVTASGFDAFNRFRGITMSIAEAPVANRLILNANPAVPGGFSIRPERVSLVSTFNTDFPRAFTVFAQRQGLYVSWTACQEDRAVPYPCNDPKSGACPEDKTQEGPCR